MSKEKQTSVTLHANFIFERETKGAVRYMEVNDKGEKLEMTDGALIGTVYLRKAKLPTSFPQKLSLVITGD
jgi:hypothetical protein